MKYCINCGTELNENDEFCTKCGTKVYEEKKEDKVVETKSEIKPSDNDKAIAFVVISVAILIVKFLVLYAKNGYDLLTNIAYTFISIPALAAITTLIVGRIVYPKNKALKIAFWLLLIPYIIFILLFVWFWITCSHIANSGCY